MALGEGKVIFYLSGKPKHFRKQGREPDPIVFTSSGDTLCPVGTIMAYLERTTSWRENNSESKFFLSFIAPHKAVTSSTIGRWLNEVLKTVGVDVSVLTGQSVRSAASSKACAKGATIAEILKCGNWSKESTWQRFYNKSISGEPTKVQEYLLKETL